MAVVDVLEGKVVAIDTAPLIYFIERHPTFHVHVRPLFAALDEGRYRAVTSMVTLLEVMVQPLRHGKPELLSKYREVLLHSQYMTALDVTATVARLAAELRAEHNLRTPDAIQLATALYAGATHFLTNDNRLKNFPRLEVLLVSDIATSSW